LNPVFWLIIFLAIGSIGYNPRAREGKKLSMARIVKEIEVGGKRLKALFDSGSLRSYIIASFVRLSFEKSVSSP
jgi:hypothetical protein